MPTLELKDLNGYLVFDEEQARQAGKALAAQYRSATPFAHIVLDNFIDPAILRRVVAQFPTPEGKTYFDRNQERLKYQFHPNEISSPIIRNLLAELNSQPVITFLKEMTGIDKLIVDPYYTGGGLHEIKRGGHLGVHADFNIHNGMNVERRLNLLIYLNDDWEEGFGGHLELWDKAMTRCERRVAPLMGRAVVFSTNLDSFHGHPEALTCPEDRARRSIALYYYTAPEAGVDALLRRTTTFQTRPGTADKTDWAVKLGHLWYDWMPPRLHKYWWGIRSRLFD
jgi:Rps23 Pro-64 3,4-dihydroxylase Tpa1-like proline 4-hydroxylase